MNFVKSKAGKKTNPIYRLPFACSCLQNKKLVFTVELNVNKYIDHRTAAYPEEYADFPCGAELASTAEFLLLA